MNLAIYKTENARRNDYTKITDNHLIEWDPTTQNTFKSTTAPECILAKGAESTNFVSKHDFNRRVQLLSKGLLNYIDWNNVVVAGGCISNSINGEIKVPNTQTSDIDLFMYGLTEEEARDKIAELLQDIHRSVVDRFGGSTSILKNDYTITLVSSNNKEVKVQIILRLYKCVYEILAGFDVDSCAVAYNGHQVYLTDRSLNAFQTRMNIVDMSRRSPSYEHRLHKYNSRGFGIYIPFDWTEYNKLYFLNRHTQGLDRLLILQRYNCRPGLQRLLNYITKRRNIKFSNRPTSNYEGTEELEINHKNGLRISTTQFNQRVTEPFRYTIFDSLRDFQVELGTTKFIVHNPGQQLTGSFQPLTSGDWITSDYSQLGVDLLGRSTILQDIKTNNKVSIEDLYSLKVRDNSLFNALDYLIMYHPNDEFLTRVWDNRHRFLFNQAKNLYEFNHLDLAMICRRHTLVQHILAKEQETIKWDRYIDLAMYLDDLTLLKSIYHYYKNSITEQRDRIKKYHCTRIGDHFGMELQAEDHSLIAKMTGKDTAQRLGFIMEHPESYSQDAYHDLLSLGDYQRFTDEELRIYFRKTGDLRPRDLLLHDTRRQVVIDQTYFNEYPQESFERMWYSCCLQELEQNESKKDATRSERAMSILRQLFPRKRVDEVLTVIYENPIEKLAPLTLLKMRKIWQQDYTDLNIKIWADNEENIQYRHLIFVLDDYSILTQFVNKNHMGGFLGKWRSNLGPKLLAKWKEIKAQQISLSTELHRKYAEALCNTDAHLSVLENGSLPKNGITVENAFGQTPFDYAIGQLMYLWERPLSDVELDQLINLRTTTACVDRRTPIVRCTKKMVSNSALDIIVDNI
uniref:Uncharacterized protein n=1 Tax=Marseillevirus LCMAC201 TaxID=2506605 RepID=A0A481YWH0_9VIRU|nr:MAG: hypothetical protein LCMAC201_01430 [Marseillevirus LCMAC201]